VQAVAGQVGMSCHVRDFDYGVDLTLHEVTVRTSPQTGRKRYVESGWPLDIQIKSTADAVVANGTVRYDLDIDTYNDLRDPDVQSSRILVLHAQPAEEQSRLEQTADGLLLRGRCYWISLRGRPAVDNRRSTCIHIPGGNIFCAGQLNEIMRRVKSGELL
jgi:hypothetical protein